MANQYFIISIIVFIFILLVMAKTVILNRRKQDKKLQQSFENSSRPITAGGSDEDHKKRIKILILALAIAIFIGAVVYYIFREDGFSGSGKANIASMIPIWVAVFIPILVNKKKPSDQNKFQKISLGENVGRMLLLLAGVFILLIGVVIFVFYNK